MSGSCDLSPKMRLILELTFLLMYNLLIRAEKVGILQLNLPL
jgi:hypothetical protein